MKIGDIEYKLVPQEPSVSNEMKAQFIDEFSWQEDATYYDEHGILHSFTATRTVPWDLCKRIFKAMARKWIVEMSTSVQRKVTPIAFSKDGNLFWHGNPSTKRGLNCDLYAQPEQKPACDGVRYSTDYEALWDLICTGQDALCLVDYRFLDQPQEAPNMRDPARVRRKGPYQIGISARGISYACIYPFDQDQWPDEKTLFLASCKSVNLEWAQQVKDQPATPGSVS